MLPANTHTHTSLRCSLLGNKHAQNLSAKNNYLIISHSFCGSGFEKGSTGWFWLSISQAVESQVGAEPEQLEEAGLPFPLPLFLPLTPPSLRGVLSGAFSYTVKQYSSEAEAISAFVR